MIYEFADQSIMNSWRTKIQRREEEDWTTDKIWGSNNNKWKIKVAITITIFVELEVFILCNFYTIVNAVLTLLRSQSLISDGLFCFPFQSNILWKHLELKFDLNLYKLRKRVNPKTLFTISSNMTSFYNVVMTSFLFQ